jgi:hypothetical protein
MQTRSEEFRAQVAECQKLADHSPGLIKEQYEQLARQWLFLAERAKACEALPQRAATQENVRYLGTAYRQSPIALWQFRTTSVCPKDVAPA